MKNNLTILILFIYSFIYAQEPLIIREIGNIPVLLSAPHGGKVKPLNTVERVGLDYKTSSDANTIEILLEVSKELQNIWGIPYHVYTNIHRSRLDVNREIEEALGQNGCLVNNYLDYHSFIKFTSAAIGEKLFVIDIHGHTHEEEMVEIGYGYNPSFIRSEQMWGTKSFGGIINNIYNREIAYPPAKKKPKEYFIGGYITQKNYFKEHHIQVEVPKSIRFNREKRKKFSKALANTIKIYYKKYLYE